MCNFIKTCTAGAPAATQPPEQISEQADKEFNVIGTIYTYTNIAKGTTDPRVEFILPK